jgi:preprotein translocase subunit SecG
MFALILLSNFAIPRAGSNNVNLDNTLDGIESTSTPLDNTTSTTKDTVK